MGRNVPDAGRPVLDRHCGCMHIFGLADDLGHDAWADYVDRYWHVAGLTAKSYRYRLYTLAQGNRPAFAVADAALNGAGTLLTLTFNRYAVGTDGGFTGGLSLSGGQALSNPAQTGSRTWTLTVTPAAAPSATLAYDSGLGDVTDAGNTALASFSGLSLSGGRSGAGGCGFLGSPIRY